MTSREKVNLILDRVAQDQAPLLAAATPLLAMAGQPTNLAGLLRLPDTDEALDAELARYAQMLLGLRSDAAPALRVGLQATPELAPAQP